MAYRVDSMKASRGRVSVNFLVEKASLEAQYYRQKTNTTSRSIRARNIYANRVSTIEFIPIYAENTLASKINLYLTVIVNHIQLVTIGVLILKHTYRRQRRLLLLEIHI